MAGLRRPGPPAPPEPPPTPTAEHPHPLADPSTTASEGLSTAAPQDTSTPPARGESPDARRAGTTPPAGRPSAPTTRDERQGATAPQDVREADPEAGAPAEPASVAAPTPSPASPLAGPAAERPVEPSADATRNDHAPELIKNDVEPLRPGSAAPSATGGGAPVADGGEPPSPSRPRAKRKRGHRLLPTGATPAPAPRERGAGSGTAAGRAGADRSSADPSSADRVSADHPAADHPAADHPAADRTPAEPSAAEPSAAQGAETAPETAPAPPRRPWLLPTALVLLSALLLALGAWFQTAASRVAHDRALVDAAGTAEVGEQVRDAVERAFSYDFADVGATERAAAEVLVGRAECQYDAIFGQVRALAPEQKLVVTVKAVTSGVTSLDGDRATVLLFLDQVTTRTTDNRSGGGVAMMRVGARKEGDRWLVDGMDLFGQDATQAAELAKCANAG
ncbi:hypothetical protein CNX65_32530 [Actinosynnema pretiosum]|uniref:Integral membrane protein n=1 Tax=Actinosynnema pretiosum TaxID=42197 RepID=A0A290ZEL1_9PSEU|nr:hypothetical protein CNX65_32530 [Actinosynnema pretiosum]